MRRRSSGRRAALAVLCLFALGVPGIPSLAAEPVRLATLLPYVDEALRGLPATRVQVVAEARRTVAEPPRPGVADLGSAHAPNLEKLAASGAQVVVGDERLHKALQPKIEAVGAEALLVRGDSVDGTLDGLLQVARRVKVEREMAARIAQTRDALRRLTLVHPVSTLVLFDAPGSFLVVTPATWLGDLLTRLGFNNIGAKASAGAKAAGPPGYLALNDEVMASLQPDLVLIVAHGDPRETEGAFRRMVQERAAWSGLAGARLGIHVLDPALFSANPGLRLGEAAEAVTALVAARSR